VSGLGVGATLAGARAFGLIAAVPVTVGYTRQARRGRPAIRRRVVLSEAKNLTTAPGEIDGGASPGAHRIGGMSRQATDCADVAEWQTLQT
jgi:hypothetical protein